MDLTIFASIDFPMENERIKKLAEKVDSEPKERAAYFAFFFQAELSVKMRRELINEFSTL